jgi:hypothetical protein
LAGDRSMTIEYKDSKRIVKLSTDTVETITLDEDFSSYTTQSAADASWVPEDTAESRVNITDDDIDFTYGATTNTRIYHDLQNELGSGVFLDTKFVLRGKFRWSVLTLGVDNDRMFFGVGSGTGDKNEADSIQMEYRQTNPLLRISYGAGSLGSSTSITSLSTSTDYYWEIIRDGTSVTATIYTDSNYNTVHGTVTGTITSQSNLRYVKLMSNATSAQGAFTGTLDDVKVWNGVTSISSKPTNVQYNSLLVEKDIGNRFWFNNNLTVEDDFSSDNWTDSNASIGVTNGVMELVNTSASTNFKSVYDLQNISGITYASDKWVLQTKVTVTGITTATSIVYFGLSSGNESVGAASSADNICIRWDADNNAGVGGEQFGIITTDGAILNASSQTLVSTNDYANSDDRWVRIIRDGNTASIEMYSDSNYTTLLNSGSKTGISAIANLRYIFYSNENNARTGNATTFTFDDMKFYNGVTTPATWTNEDIFTDDYSSDSGWTSVGSSTTVNSAVAGKVNMTGDIDNWVYKDLGFNLKSKWIARGNIKATVYGTTGRSLVPVTFIDDPTIHVKNGTGNNGIGVFMDTTGGTRYFWLSIITNGAYDRGTNDSNHRISFTTGTTYYYELIRDGSTLTLRITTNSDFSGGSVITRTTTLPSNTFRYLVHGTDVATSGSNTVEADDTVVHNGVTLIN